MPALALLLLAAIAGLVAWFVDPNDQFEIQTPSKRGGVFQFPSDEA